MCDKVKTFIWLFVRVSLTFNAEGNLNASEDIEVIWLLLKSIVTLEAERKRKAPEGRLVIWFEESEISIPYVMLEMNETPLFTTGEIWLLLKSTIDRAGNFEIWLGTLVNWLPFAFILNTGLNPGVRKAFKIAPICKSVKFL